MRSRFWICSWVALLIGALALAGCGANPPAQAEPAPQTGAILPSPPPMPTSRPRPPTPTPPPAPAAVAPAGATLSADFSAGSKLDSWEVLDTAEPLDGPAVWTIKDGRLYQVSAAEGSMLQYATALVTGEPTWQNYRVSAAAYNVGNDEMGVVARAGEHGFYLFKLLPNTSTPQAVLARYDADKGIFTTLTASDQGGFAPRTWYTLSLEVQGDHLVASVDGHQLLEARDAALPTGRAGVSAYAMGDQEFDNVTVQALAPSGQ